MLPTDPLFKLSSFSRETTVKKISTLGFLLPACRRLLFPFPRATKEIGDVCTQARFSFTCNNYAPQFTDDKSNDSSMREGRPLGTLNLEWDAN